MSGLRGGGGQYGAARVDDVLDWVGRLAGPAVFLGQSVLLVWLRAFDFDFYGVQVFRPYSLICYGLLGIWLAIGLHNLTVWAHASFPWPTVRRPRLVLGVAAASGLAMVGWLVLANWDTNNRSDSDFAQRYADMVFTALPPDAVLVTSGDAVIFPLAYYHFVEKRRPDVLLLSTGGIAFPDDLNPPTLAYTTPEKRVQAIRNFVAETERTVFHTDWNYAAVHGRNVRDYGFLREVLDPEGYDTLEISTSQAAEEYFIGLFEREYTNGWELVTRNDHIFGYGQYLGTAFVSGHPEFMERMAPLREFAERDYHGLIGIASVLAESDNPERLEEAMELLETAELLNNAALTKTMEAMLHHLKGTVRLRQGRGDEAKAFFEESWEVWSHPSNLSVRHLERLNR